MTSDAELTRPGEHAVDVLRRIAAQVLPTPPPAVDSAVFKDIEASARRMTPFPTTEQMARLLDVVFFASLLREESRPVRATVGFISREVASELKLNVLAFEEPLAFEPAVLAKLAPGADPLRTHIAVGPAADGVCEVWGLIHFGSGKVVPEVRASPLYVSVATTIPGVVTVEVRGRTLVTFAEGRAMRPGSRISSLMALSKALDLKLSSPLPGTILRVAEAMVQHGHGGTLLIDISDDRDLPELDVNPHYTFVPANRVLAMAVEDAVKHYGLPGSLGMGECQRAGPYIVTCPAVETVFGLRRLDEAIEHVAQLSAVDGALVITRELEVRHFGAFFTAKIPPSEVMVVNHAGGTRTTLSGLGGARHQTAARWCAAHREKGVALVASEDGSASLVVGVQEGVGVFKPLQLSREEGMDTEPPPK